MKNINTHTRNKDHDWRHRIANEIKVKSKMLIILILCLSLVSPNLSQLLFSTSEVSAAVDTPVPNPYPPIEEIAQDDGSVKTIIHLGPKNQGYFQPETFTVVTVLVDITFYTMNGVVQTSTGISFLFKDVSKAINAVGGERDTDLNLGLTVDSKIRGNFFRVPVDNNGDVAYELSAEDEDDTNDKDNANFKNITTNYSGQLGIYYNAAIFPLEGLGGKPIMIGGTGLPIKFQDTAVPPNSILPDASLTMDGVKNSLDSLADIPGYKMNSEKSIFSFTTGSTKKKNMAQKASTISGNLLIILSDRNYGNGSIPEGAILKLVYDKVPTLTINYNHLIGGKSSPIKDASILDGDDFNSWLGVKDKTSIENYIFDPAHSEITANGKTTNLLTKYPDLTAANVQDKILTFIIENGNLSSNIQLDLAYYVKATVTPINAEVGANSKVTPQQVTQKIQLPDVPTLPDDLRNKVVYNNGDGTPVDFDFTKTTGEYVSFNQPLANIDTSKKNAVAQPTTITYTDEVNGIQGSAVANVTVTDKATGTVQLFVNYFDDKGTKLREPPPTVGGTGTTFLRDVRPMYGVYPSITKSNLTRWSDGVKKETVFGEGTDWATALKGMHSGTLSLKNGDNPDDGNEVVYIQNYIYVFDQTAILKEDGVIKETVKDTAGNDIIFTTTDKDLQEMLGTYQIVGPDGKTYATLAEALVANPTYNDSLIENGGNNDPKTLKDTEPQEFTIITVIPKLTLRTLYVDSSGKVLKTVPDKETTDSENFLTFDPYSEATKINGIEPSMAKSTYSMTADKVNMGSSYISDLQKVVDWSTEPATLAPVTNWTEALDAINGLQQDGTLAGMSDLNEGVYSDVVYTLTYVYPDQVAKIIVNGQEHESLQGFSGYEIAPKTTDEEIHKTIDVYTVTVSKRDKDGKNDTIVDPTVYSSLDEAIASNSVFDADESVDQIFTVTKKEIIRTGINTPTASVMPIAIAGLAGMVLVLKKKYSGRTKPAYKHKK